MSTPRDRDSNALEATQMLRINRLCNEFEASWQAGTPRPLEKLLNDLTGTEWQAAFRELLPLELEYRRRAGQTVVLDEYAARFPQADREWLASLFVTSADSLGGSTTNSPLPERLGDYQIIGHIGGGGMGTVYKALHVRMGRVVALKVLRPEIQQNPALIQRFDREVRAAARLTHPHIVAALDAREQDGVHFLITEFIDGQDLQAMVKDGGPLPVAAAVDCILQAARGLDYAHRQGIIHRDVKPANLLRDAGGVVRILDMGLARLDADSGSSATDLTNSGMVLGTAAYMAPEQARDVRRADARADIYSLGCTLFFLLTGRHVYSGATALDTVLSHLSQPIPSLTEVDASLPVALERIFHRMVSKEPADRYQTAAEVVQELEALQLAPAPAPARLIPTSIDTAATEIRRNSQDRSATRPPGNAAFTRVLQFNPRLWSGVVVAMILAGVAVVAVMRPATPDPAPAVAAERFELSFDGVSSYVVAPDLIPIAPEAYTLEAIVIPEVNRLGNVISWLGPNWMAIFLSEGRWGLARRVGEESHLIHADVPAVLGKPVHVAGVFQNKELHLFIDGRPVSAQNSEFNLPETHGGLYIGGVVKDQLPPDQNDRFFGGRILSVRISRGLLYKAPFQVTRSLTKETQTLALYHFESSQVEQKLIKDASGHGHDAHIHNAEWVTPQ